jgi:hypothetical protein
MAPDGGEWSASYIGKEDPILTERRLVELQSPSGECGGEKFLPLPGSELSFLDHQTCSLVSILIQISWLS